MIRIEIAVDQVDGDVCGVYFVSSDDKTDPTGAEKAVLAYLQRHFDNLMEVAGAKAFSQVLTDMGDDDVAI